MSEIVVALDGFKYVYDLYRFVHNIEKANIIYKIGKESYLRYGPEAINFFNKEKLRVFLDLKLHDIPNTVESAIDAIIDKNIWMTNIHCSGGREMMEAAAKMVEKRESKMLLIGVTALTSMNENSFHDIGFTNVDVNQLVGNMAKAAYECGLSGVVSSPLEVKRIKEETNTNFLTVTPGVRWDSNDMTKPYKSGSDDQKRTMTPLEAQSEGADFLVIGRPITQHPFPLKIISELQELLTKSTSDRFCKIFNINE